MRFFIFCLLLIPGTSILAVDGPMTLADTLSLGVVEGATEFLPVSSSAHLILTTKLLGIHNSLMYRTIDTFMVIIQFAAILATLVLFWPRVRFIIKHLNGWNALGTIYVRNLIIAFLPTGIVGYLLNDFIDKNLQEPVIIFWGLSVGSFFMLFIDKIYKKNQAIEPYLLKPPVVSCTDLTIYQCLFIGCMQTVALCPGVSRSMMTLSATILLGLPIIQCIEFTFFLGFLTISTASVYSMLPVISGYNLAVKPSYIAYSFIISFIIAFYVGRWFIQFFPKHGFGFFAFYRLGFALVFFGSFLGVEPML